MINVPLPCGSPKKEGTDEPEKLELVTMMMMIILFRSFALKWERNAGGRKFRYDELLIRKWTTDRVTDSLPRPMDRMDDPEQNRGYRDRGWERERERRSGRKRNGTHLSIRFVGWIAGIMAY